MTQHNADNHTTRLSLRRRIGQIFVYPLWLFCEVAAWILRPKKLTPRENTRRCYETLWDPFFAANGVLEDYTEGHFPDSNEIYEEAQIKQLDFILDQCECGEQTKVFEMGCGNGKLLQRAKERGASAHGITLSQEQVDICTKKGLNITRCDFDDIQNYFEPHQFDVVVFNGSAEHYVTELDALNGLAEEKHSNLVENTAYLLKPGGKLFFTCIHFRFDTDAKKALQHPLRHKIGSYYFYYSTLVRFYSGWYPLQGQYEIIANRFGFTKTFERNATYDYYLTSLIWDDLFIEFRKKNKGFIAKFLMSHFLTDPRYFLTMVLYAGYGVWTWQFRDTEERGDGRPSPMVHYWLMFEAPYNN